MIVKNLSLDIRRPLLEIFKKCIWAQSGSISLIRGRNILTRTVKKMINLGISTRIVLFLQSEYKVAVEVQSARDGLGLVELSKCNLLEADSVAAGMQFFEEGQTRQVH